MTFLFQIHSQSLIFHLLALALMQMTAESRVLAWLLALFLRSSCSCCNNWNRARKPIIEDEIETIDENGGNLNSVNPLYEKDAEDDPFKDDFV